MKNKTVYYSDELNDDFAGNHIEPRQINSEYTYIHKSLLWIVTEYFLYYAIAIPLIWLFSKIAFGLKIRNRRSVAQIRDGGVFLYGNHTHLPMDAFIPALIAFPRKAFIITSPDAVSIKGLRTIVQMLGAIPVPKGVLATKHFLAAIHDRVGAGHAIAIYPEAHIWPYFTGIRPFPATSFEYPVLSKSPAIAYVVTYRRRRLLSFLPPKITVTVSECFYPDESVPKKEAKQILREQVYVYMCEVSSLPDNYQYIKYIKI